jgi:hypothetical protein
VSLPGSVARHSRLLVRLGLIVALMAALAFGSAIGVVLASHQFADVPDSNIYHNDIDAIADAGVTTGCGGGNYCPNDYVTRGQMAAFLNRLGALAPGKVPVVNADRLDGLDANELARVNYGQNISSPTITDTESTYGEVTIVAPTAGYVLATASVTFNETACTSNCIVVSHVLHVEGGVYGNWGLETIDEYANVGHSAVFPVETGTNTFRIRVLRGNGDGTILGWWSEISALFVPFGANGLTPAVAPVTVTTGTPSSPDGLTK